MDDFQKMYPHLKWPWWRRKWFLLRYDIAMANGWLKTEVYVASRSYFSPIVALWRSFKELINE